VQILDCQALLFDMDGVLLTSTPAVERVWRKWALERGFDPAHVVNLSHGRRSVETIRELLPDSDHEAENLEVERREIEDRDGIEPIPGARELLESLPLDRWAVVTSATRPLAEVRLRAAGLPIPKKLITAEDVMNGKPDPEPYRRGAELLHIAPEGCVVVEDVPPGIRSAHAAGMRVIALTTTVSADQLADADYIVKDCSALGTNFDGKRLMIRIQN
jgi:sugar-phosphatase